MRFTALIRERFIKVLNNLLTIDKGQILYYGLLLLRLSKEGKKSTIGSKATDIEKACKIRMGEEGLCNSEISDSLTLIQFPNGIVLKKKMAKEAGLIE